MRESPFLPAVRGMARACGLALFVFLVHGIAHAGVSGSRHDFSLSGPTASYQTTKPYLGSAGPCSACHRPHKVAITAGRPLWARDLSNEASWFNQTANPNYVAGTTLLCYDCHDNEVAAMNPTPADDDPPFADWHTNGTFGTAQDIAFHSNGSLAKVGYYENKVGEKPPLNLPIAGNPTGGHYFKSLPTGTPVYLTGDKLPCSVCHDPHNKDTGSNQVFFRASTWNGGVTVALTTYGSSKTASDNTRSGLALSSTTNTGREMCAECHAYSNAGTPKVLYGIPIMPPTVSMTEHQSGNTVPCTNCHSHDKIFMSCAGCHGNEDVGNYWPDSKPITEPGGNGTVYPNRAGVHDQHVQATAQGRTGGTPTMDQKNATCSTCHPSPGIGGHDVNTSGSPVNTADVHRDSWNLTTHFLKINGAANGLTTESYNNATTVGGKVCSNVDCHYRTPTPSTGGTPPNVGWANPAETVGCSSCHGGANAIAGAGWVGTTLPNAHMKHVGNDFALNRKNYECTNCHAFNPALYAHENGVVDWNMNLALDPTSSRTETYNSNVTGTTTVKYGSGSFASCANLYCHIQSPTPRIWSQTIGPAECLLCHQKGQTAAPNPSSGLHYGATAPVVTGTWHDDTIGASGCPTCHTSVTAQATHVNGTFEAVNGQTTQMGLFADYHQSADGVGTCYGSPGVVGAAGCHDGTGEQGSWQRVWNSAVHYNGTQADVPCAGCHGGTGTLPANNWTFGTGAHNAADGSVEHGYASWDALPAASVIGEHSAVGTFPDTQDLRCELCHAYPKAVYLKNVGGKIGWVGNTSNNSTYHGNNSIEMNSSQAYVTTAGADQYGCLNNCHGVGLIKMEGSGWPVRLIVGPEGDCSSCHNGSKIADGAPNVTTYWTGSGVGLRGGHGSPGITLSCTVCHNTNEPTSPASAGHKTGTYNSIWNNTSRSTNTAHLKPDYFTKYAPAPVGDYSIQVAFDNYCQWECHNTSQVDDNLTPTVGHRHKPTTTDSLAQRTNQFVNSATVLFLTGSADLYTLPIDIDLNTGASAAGPIHYAPCISCHDPHGTGTSKDATESSNHMLRDNFELLLGAPLCGRCHQ